MKGKKGVGISFNMLITIIIALIVVIIISAIGLGKVRFFSSNLVGEGSCEARGGVCVTKTECLGSTGSISAFGCEDNQVCCMGYCEANKGRCGNSCNDNEVKSPLHYCKQGVCCMKKEDAGG